MGLFIVEVTTKVCMYESRQKRGDDRTQRIKEFDGRKEAQEPESRRREREEKWMPRAEKPKVEDRRPRKYFAIDHLR